MKLKHCWKNIPIRFSLALVIAFCDNAHGLPKPVRVPKVRFINAYGAWGDMLGVEFWARGYFGQLGVRLRVKRTNIDLPFAYEKDYSPKSKESYLQMVISFLESDYKRWRNETKVVFVPAHVVDNEKFLSGVANAICYVNGLAIVWGESNMYGRNDGEKKTGFAVSHELGHLFGSGHVNNSLMDTAAGYIFNQKTIEDSSFSLRWPKGMRQKIKRCFKGGLVKGPLL